MDEVPSHARGRTANRVKHRAPAKLQITAEQLFREAWERKHSVASALPKIRIADHEELLEYQRNERKQYEMRMCGTDLTRLYGFAMPVGRKTGKNSFELDLFGSVQSATIIETS